MIKQGGYWKNRLGKKYNTLQNKKVKRGAILANFRINGLTKGIDIAYQWYNKHPVGYGIDLEKTKEVCEALFPSTIPPDIRPLAVDSPIGNPTLHKLQGLKVTAASLKYAYIANVLSTHIWRFRTKAQQFNVVWEIGSGYGGQARALMLTGKVRSYISQDFPEHIILQQYFLKEYEDKVWWLTPNLSPPEPVDIVICTHAMMEMNKDEIENYFNLVQENLKPGGFFYTVDAMEKCVLDEYPTTPNLKQVWCMPFPDYKIGKIGKQYLYKKVELDNHLP